MCINFIYAYVIFYLWSPVDIALLTSLKYFQLQSFFHPIFSRQFLVSSGLPIIAHLSRGQSNAWKFCFALVVLPIWKAHNQGIHFPVFEDQNVNSFCPLVKYLVTDQYFCPSCHFNLLLINTRYGGYWIQKNLRLSQG